MILLCFLLIYFWYFYLTSFERVTKPLTGSPSNPPQYKIEFDSKNQNHFQFIVNGNKVWEHNLPVDTFTFNLNKIVPVDSCHGIQNGKFVLASGKTLYDYFKIKPEISNQSNFKENSQFTVQHGNIFYFKCLNNHIEKLHICPSGTTLIKNVCESINLCTDKPNGTTLPSQNFSSRYILCINGKENIQNCPKQHVFNYNRCEHFKNLNVYCKLYSNKPFLLDDVTKVICQNEKPVFISCISGTKYFDKTYCEPALCQGLADGEKIPMPIEKMDPFYFVPGYITCRNSKIHETVECNQNWDEMLSKGDNLTSLPMVFNGKTCSIPTFCENVFSHDKDVIVPVHEFTKHVKNWKLSKIFDHAAGFECINKTKKRKIIPADSRISKRFKIEPACKPSMPNHLAIYDNPKLYYDCESKSIMPCPDSTFFNGLTCIPEPTNAFTYKGLPLFQFNSLNAESWIKPWDYSKNVSNEGQCHDPESSYIRLYNICSHPDCEQFAFLSQIPDMAILLPREHKAKCQFDERRKKLRKKTVEFEYHFWNQKMVSEDEIEKPCIPGQNIETGNFIWDTTIFSTCNIKEPFIFCPSTHTRRIIPIGSHFVCEPPKSNSYNFNNADWTHFETNEIKRILPLTWDGNKQYIQKNKASAKEILPEEGLEIPEGQKLNILVDQPVKIEPRYRVTHPPNVVFDYDHQSNMSTTIAHNAFLVKLKNFTNKSLTFPRYKPIKFADLFDESLYL